MIFWRLDSLSEFGKERFVTAPIYILKSAQIYYVWFSYIVSNERIWQIDSDVKMLIFLWYFSMCVFFLCCAIFVALRFPTGCSVLELVHTIYRVDISIEIYNCLCAKTHMLCWFFVSCFSDFRMFASYIGAFFVSLYAVMLQNIRKSKDYPIEI